MKKDIRKSIFIPLSLGVILLCSCTNTEPKEPISQIINSETHHVEIFANDSSILMKPAGIAYFNDKIVVSDYENHALVVFDKMGNHLSTIGEVGSAPLQFNNPGAITYAEDTLYVLDMGNRRIQCLNSEFEYIDSIYLWEEIQYYQFPYTDVAVKEGDIYVSSGSLSKKDVGVYSVSPDGYENVFKKAYGFLDAATDEILFINSGELTTQNKMTMLNMQCENYLFSFDSDEKIMLPSSLYSSDFIVTENEIIVLSFDGSSILKLNRTGDYIETVADFRSFGDDETEWSMNSYITMDDEGNLYSTNRNGGTIYKVSPK